jgi:hypothetical protein
MEFLRTADGTNGWSSLLRCIVVDMIRAGPDGTFADGYPRMNGIVIGFMSTTCSFVNSAAVVMNEREA